jgi:hypothetical protein
VYLHSELVVVDKLLVYLIYLLHKKARTEAIPDAGFSPIINNSYAEETIALMRLV